MSNELYFEHLKGQTQFAYFQLGVAASAIAFAVHETAGRSLHDTPWLVGAGVSAWALSFALGCFGLNAHQRGIATNVRYLEATAGLGQFAHDPGMQQSVARARSITQRELDRPLTRFRWQQWLLFSGALLYIGGHVILMSRTPSKQATSQVATSPGVPLKLSRH